MQTPLREESWGPGGDEGSRGDAGARALLGRKAARRAGAPPALARGSRARYLDLAIAVVHHSFPGCHLWFGVQESHIKLILENLRCRGVWEKPGE